MSLCNSRSKTLEYVNTTVSQLFSLLSKAAADREKIGRRQSGEVFDDPSRID
jgi:hypothetical protein